MSHEIRLARPDVGEAELAAVASVLAGGQLTMGPQVAAFETAVARAVGTADAARVEIWQGKILVVEGAKATWM